MRSTLILFVLAMTLPACGSKNEGPSALGDAGTVTPRDGGQFTDAGPLCVPVGRSCAAGESCCGGSCGPNQTCCAGERQPCFRDSDCCDPTRQCILVNAASSICIDPDAGVRSDAGFTP